MKELLESIAAVILTLWGYLSAAVSSLGAVRAELWENAWWPPLLLFGVLKARETPAPLHSEPQDAAPKRHDIVPAALNPDIAETPTGYPERESHRVEDGTLASSATATHTALVAEVARLPVNESGHSAMHPPSKCEAGTLASSATATHSTMQTPSVAEVTRLPVNESAHSAMHPPSKCEAGTLASSATATHSTIQTASVAEVARLSINESAHSAMHPPSKCEAGTLASSATATHSTVQTASVAEVARLRSTSRRIGDAPAVEMRSRNSCEFRYGDAFDGTDGFRSGSRQTSGQRVGQHSATHPPSKCEAGTLTSSAMATHSAMQTPFVAEVARLPINESAHSAMHPPSKCEAGTLASSATATHSKVQTASVAEVARLPVNESAHSATHTPSKCEDGTLASSATATHSTIQTPSVAEVARLPVNESAHSAMHPPSKCEAGTLASSATAARTPIDEDGTMPSLVPNAPASLPPAEDGTLASSATATHTPINDAGTLASSATAASLPPRVDACPTSNVLSEPVVRAALESCLEVVNLTVMAQGLGVPRRVLSDFINARPQLQALVDASRLALARRANALLGCAVGEQQPWAIIFALESKGGHQYGRDDDEPADTSNIPKMKRPRRKAKPAAAPHDPAAENSSAAAAAEPDHVKRLDQNGNVAQTLRAHAGEFRFAARKLGVTPQQLMDYVLLRPELQAELDDRREELLDHAETILSHQVDALRPWAIRFVLLTLGQALGWARPVRPRRRRARPPETAAADKPAQRAAAVPSAPVPEHERARSGRHVEAKLRAALQDNGRWVVRFLLMKLGRARGYVQADLASDRQPPAPKPIGVFDLSRLTPEERAEYEQLLAIVQGRAPAGPAAAQPAPGPATSALPEASGAPPVPTPAPDKAAAQPAPGPAPVTAVPTVAQSTNAPASTTKNSPPVDGSSSESRPAPEVAPAKPEVGDQVQSLLAAMNNTDWLQEVNEGIFKFKDRYRRAFGRNYESSERGRMTMIDINKQIRILPIEMTEPWTTQSPGGKGTGPPSGKK